VAVALLLTGVSAYNLPKSTSVSAATRRMRSMTDMLAKDLGGFDDEIFVDLRETELLQLL
jgi:hypothetical protein